MVKRKARGRQFLMKNNWNFCLVLDFLTCNFHNIFYNLIVTVLLHFEYLTSTIDIISTVGGRLLFNLSLIMRVDIILYFI